MKHVRYGGVVDSDWRKVGQRWVHNALEGGKSARSQHASFAKLGHEWHTSPHKGAFYTFGRHCIGLLSYEKIEV